MNTERCFRDRCSVVTGAASGIGLALTRALLQRGAKVLMADCDSEALARAVAPLGDYVRQVQHDVVDVTDAQAVARLIDSATERLGRLDYLFNNAGIGGTLPIGEATLAHWRRIIDVNLWGVIYGVQAALPVMRRQGGGHIINTASISGLLPVPGQALYNTTKYAIVGLSESLRHELADEGIHVSVVCPGMVATGIFGVPILGQRVEAKAPPGALPADVAARAILDGVARKEGIIVLPARERWAWRLHRVSSPLMELAFRSMARQRRAALERLTCCATGNATA
jgi:NAD(P)-dependent dehydrogenase (short-subunit alcohol dehydrogenase family)